MHAGAAGGHEHYVRSRRGTGQRGCMLRRPLPVGDRGLLCATACATPQWHFPRGAASESAGCSILGVRDLAESEIKGHSSYWYSLT
jgi:hypothetical protein